MKLVYLVTGIVSYTPYMCDSIDETVQNLVMADTPTQAENKFRKHYDDQTVEYSTYVYVKSCRVEETIT